MKPVTVFRCGVERVGKTVSDDCVGKEDRGVVYARMWLTKECGRPLMLVEGC